jgi:hypothetical protein
MVRAGLVEAVTVSLTNPGILDGLRVPRDHPWRRMVALRNPMDESRSSGESKGLARLSPTLAEVERRFQEAQAKLEAEEKESKAYGMERERLAIEKARNEAELALLKYEEEKKTIEEKAQARDDTWEVIVLRGGTAQTQTFTQSRPRDQR